VIGFPNFHRNKIGGLAPFFFRLTVCASFHGAFKHEKACPTKVGRSVSMLESGNNKSEVPSPMEFRNRKTWYNNNTYSRKLNKKMPNLTEVIL